MSTKNSIPASDSSSTPGTTDAGQCSMASPLQAASSSTTAGHAPVDTGAPVGIDDACPQGYSMSKGNCPILGLDGCSADGEMRKEKVRTTTTGL